MSDIDSEEDIYDNVDSEIKKKLVILKQSILQKQKKMHN